MVNLLSYAWKHPLAGRNIRTLRRIVEWQILARTRPGPHTRDWINGSTITASRGDTGATGNLYFGLHEVEDMAFFAHMLRPGDIFIDAGANIGSFTILAGVMGANVHAFEPAAETVDKLRKNIEANRINAVIHQIALGAESGELRFTIGKGSCNRLAEDGDVLVPVQALDSLAISPTAIKFDLEGGELNALRGATNVLRSPDLLAVEAETVDRDSEKILMQAGFARRWYDPFTRRLSASPTGKPNNQLWIRNEAEVVRRVRDGPVVTYQELSI